MGEAMKFWTIAGLLASAFLLTVIVRHKEQKTKISIKDPDQRYCIDELLGDLDS